jgi:hypothetical protein
MAKDEEVGVIDRIALSDEVNAANGSKVATAKTSNELSLGLFDGLAFTVISTYCWGSCLGGSLSSGLSCYQARLAAALTIDWSTTATSPLS